MSSSPQTTPLSRKYPEYTSCVMTAVDFTKVSYDQQSIEVEPSTKESETGIIRNAWTQFMDLTNPIARKNMAQLFQSGYQRAHSVVHDSLRSGYQKSNYSRGDRPPLHPSDKDSGSKPCLGCRPLISAHPPKYAPEYVWLSYEDVDCRRRDIGSALTWFFGRLEGKKKGRDVEIPGEIQDERGLVIDTICLWSVNTPEWQIVDIACQAYGKVLAALYESSSDDIAEFVLNHAEAPILFLTLNHLPSILRFCSRLKYLKSIVLLHSNEELALYDTHGQTLHLAKAWAASFGIEFWVLEDFEMIGRQHPSEPMTDIPPDTVYSLCYTSGTTGQPKAVILTHGQGALTVSCGVWGVVDLYKDIGVITLAVLPLVHAYQRMINLGALNYGGAVGFPNPDPAYFIEDAQLVKPTLITAVPRLVNRIYQSITARIAGQNGGIKAKLFNLAVKTKMEALRFTGKIDHSIWDKIFFNKIKRIVGGCCKMPDLQWYRFFPHLTPTRPDNAFQGYGLTETFALSCRVSPYDPTGSYTIGPVLPFSEAKVIDAPELSYFVRPQTRVNANSSTTNGWNSLRPRGELCLRVALGGRCPGYYKDPVSTKYTFDSEGWIHTADIVELDERGRFKIIDRRKNIVKLSQGEFVALERIETLYTASPVLSQLFVYGDMTRDYLVAVVVPAEGLNIGSDVKPGSDPNDNHALKMYIYEALEEQARTLNLKGYEKIRNIYMTYDAFNVEDGTLTPTLKIKRKEAHEKFKTVIEELYTKPLPVLPSSTGVKTKL